MNTRRLYPWLLAVGVLSLSALLWAAGRAQGQTPKAIPTPVYRIEAPVYSGTGKELIETRKIVCTNMPATAAETWYRNVLPPIHVVFEGGNFYFFPWGGPSPQPGPRILSFVAEPAEIKAGQSATLKWTTEGATAVTLSCSPNVQPAAGSFAVAPTVTTAYTLTAKNAQGMNTANVTVTVSSDPIVKLFGAIVVEETKDRTPLQAKVQDAIHKWCDGKKLQYARLDQNVVDESGKPPADMAAWLEKAKGKTLPYLLLVGQNGQVAWEGSQPTTEAAALELLKKLGG